MTRPQTIIVAVDASRGSEAAIVRAATLAARAGATLHIVTANTDGLESQVSRDDLATFADAALGPGATHVAADEISVLTGRTVPDAILTYASEASADLLVVGTRGRSGLDRLLVGSVAEACVAGSPCPVLVVPRGAEAHEPSAGAPVLVAVDFGDLSRKALAVGRTLADLHAAPLRAVHVVRELGPYTGLSPSALDLAGVDPERAEGVAGRMARFAETAGVPLNGAHVSLGSPSRQIPAVAASVEAGAIVMGTHGRTGVSHALLGSTTEATLRRASCAVLTVRSQPKAPRVSRRSARLARRVA